MIKIKKIKKNKKCVIYMNTIEPILEGLGNKHIKLSEITISRYESLAKKFKIKETEWTIEKIQ
jgi:hypothetical protein